MGQITEEGQSQRHLSAKLRPGNEQALALLRRVPQPQTSRDSPRAEPGQWGMPADTIQNFGERLRSLRQQALEQSTGKQQQRWEQEWQLRQRREEEWQRRQQEQARELQPQIEALGLPPREAAATAEAMAAGQLPPLEEQLEAELEARRVGMAVSYQGAKPTIVKVGESVRAERHRRIKQRCYTPPWQQVSEGELRRGLALLHLGSRLGREVQPALPQRDPSLAREQQERERQQQQAGEQLPQQQGEQQCLGGLEQAGKLRGTPTAREFLDGAVPGWESCRSEPPPETPGHAEGGLGMGSREPPPTVMRQAPNQYASRAKRSLGELFGCRPELGPTPGAGGPVAAQVAGPHQAEARLNVDGLQAALQEGPGGALGWLVEQQARVMQQAAALPPQQAKEFYRLPWQQQQLHLAEGLPTVASIAEPDEGHFPWWEEEDLLGPDSSWERHRQLWQREGWEDWSQQLLEENPEFFQHPQPLVTEAPELVEEVLGCLGVLEQLQADPGALPEPTDLVEFEAGLLARMRPKSEFQAHGLRRNYPALKALLAPEGKPSRPGARMALSMVEHGCRFHFVNPRAPCQQEHPRFEQNLRRVSRMIARTYGPERVEEFLAGDRPHPAHFPNHPGLQKHEGWAFEQAQQWCKTGALKAWPEHWPPPEVILPCGEWAMSCQVSGVAS